MERTNPQAARATFFGWAPSVSGAGADNTATRYHFIYRNRDIRELNFSQAHLEALTSPN